MTKKIVFALIFLILASAAIFFFINLNKPQSQTKNQAQNSTQTSKIRVGLVSTRYSHLPVIVALDKGIFKKNNLDVSVQKTDKSAIDMLLSNVSDVTVSTPMSFISGAASGAKVAYLLSTVKDEPLVLLSNKKPSEIKTLGISRLGGELQLRSEDLFKGLNIDPKKITFQVSGNQKASLGLISQNKLDATIASRLEWLMYQNQASSSSASLIKVLVDSSAKDETMQPGGLISKTDFLENNKQAVTDFAKSLVEAASWINANQDETAQILSKETQLSLEQSKMIVSDYLELSKGLDPIPSKEKLTQTLKSLEAQNPKVKDYNIDNFIDPSISNQINTPK